MGDVGRVPAIVMQHALANVRQTAHGSDGDALAAIADMWCKAAGEDLPALIGTERYAWSESGTMPVDPAIIASIARTRSGISAGADHALDVFTGASVTHKHRGKRWGSRLRVAPMVQRSGEHPRRYVMRGANRGTNHITGEHMSSCWWHVHELPAIAHDGEHAFMGHGAMAVRPATTRQVREANARDTLSESFALADRIATLAAAGDSDATATAMREAIDMARKVHKSGRFGWSTHDARGVFTISVKGRVGVSGDGVRVSGARTAKAAAAAMAASVHVA